MRKSMLDLARETVASDIDRRAAAYDREIHLAALIRRPFGSTAEIIEKLECAIRAAKNAIGRGHWTADPDRLINLRAALKAESDPTVGDCDVCGRRRPLSRLIAFGIETAACDECRDGGK